MELSRDVWHVIYQYLNLSDCLNMMETCRFHYQEILKQKRLFPIWIKMDIAVKVWVDITGRGELTYILDPELVVSSRCSIVKGKPHGEGVLYDHGRTLSQIRYYDNGILLSCYNYTQNSLVSKFLRLDNIIRYEKSEFTIVIDDKSITVTNVIQKPFTVSTAYVYNGKIALTPPDIPETIYEVFTRLATLLFNV